MRNFRSQAVIAVVVGLSIAATGCSQINMLKAKLAFREANTAYQKQDYAVAAEKYEEVLATNPTEPQLLTAYFYLGNSLDNMYRPGREGDAENDALLQRAIENYKIAVERLEEVPQIRTLSMQYLVAAYGPDKLNDPSQAEPLLRRMIQENPRESANYFLLARLYEDVGDYENAEATLVAARDARPNDPVVYTNLAAYYDRQGEFDKLVQALEDRVAQEPNNPEAHYTIATYYFNKASRDFSLTDAEKAKYAEGGLAAVDRALALNENYMEALVFKNLLLRVQANVEGNRARQEALLREADAIRDRAEEIRQQKASGL